LFKNNSTETQNKIILDYETNKICYYYKIEEKEKEKSEEIKNYQTPNSYNIINNYDMIGYCHKNYSNVKYPDNINKINFKNENLIKAIELYFYYQEFSKKIKETKSNEKEYFLINKDYMADIKINYKYKEIKDILDTINFMDSNNKKILAIKSLSNDIIKYFKENKDIKKNYEKDFIEPDIIPINEPNKKAKFYMIYDKFEILEREKAHDLFDGIYKKYGINRIFVIYGSENNCLKCEINEGKIIIHYPQDFFCNDKCISVIGQLNYENQFLNDYILIYNDSSSKSNHMNYIKKNLNQYLTSLQLYENSAPITDKHFK
jgi:hypothetical protein